MTSVLISEETAMKSSSRSSRLSRIGLVITVLVSALASPLMAATFTVTNTNDSGAGSLRAAVLAAANGDVINFSVSGTITLTTGQLNVTTGITIQGAGALTISGNNLSRIFNVTSANAVSISGLTLTNGKSTAAQDAFGGGAILVNMAGTPAFNLTDSTVTNNDASLAGNPLGGGIDNEGGTVTITRCAIVNNTATFRGGGIQNQGSGSMTIVNSTIANNTAGTTGVGGGIRSLLPLTLTSDTIYGNSANSAGNVSNGSNTVTFQNTIIAGGILIGGGVTGPDIVGASFNSLDYNLIQNTSGGTIAGTTTHNITGVSPVLGPLQNNGGPTPTMAPLFGSAVIDAGFSAGVTTDQRGLTRPADLPSIPNAAGGDGADIGSVELQSAPVNTPLTPAPSSILLLLTGLGMVALWMFRRSLQAQGLV